ncbi:MAG: hypothetical protein A2152_03965 [Candidatus Levybacteria bacterium RBG_16_35_6]|nr:MAG: hypothetical protein A2152_03965 [Candidatus Levybacteria bacterium RBG_16_35_6]
MRNTIWEKRIPTLLGIFFILIGIGVTSLLVKQGIIFIGKAAPVYTPKQVSITNITDSSFTINYLTDEKTVGSINYGKDQKLGQIARDDRDQEKNSLTPTKIHNMTVRGLSPLTKYYFSITNGEETYTNEGESYIAQTGDIISEPPPQQIPLSGKVITLSGTAPKEGLISASIEGSQTISTLLKEDGSYILPLNSLRNSGFSRYFDFSKKIIRIDIVGDDLSRSIVITNIDQNPIPTITLSKDYNFSSGVEPDASSSAQLQILPTVPIQSEKVSSVSISTPVENDSFTDNRPVFSGTANPNETVTIIIHSDDAIETTVRTDSLGNWEYRPEKQLSPGQHTITISSKDSAGATRYITRTFTVFEQGSQVSESATPSATPTITITPTNTPTPIVIPTETPTPTGITPTNTPIPTATLTPIPIGSPTPTLAPTGSSSVAGFGILAFAIVLFGGLLFLLSRGSIAL